MPPEPVAFDPAREHAAGASTTPTSSAGGTSFWFDRVLEPAVPQQPGHVPLHPRPGPLHVHAHAGHARLRAAATPTGSGPTGNNQNLYTVAISGSDARPRPRRSGVQYPSHWSSVHTAAGPERRPAQVHHVQQRGRHGAHHHQHRRRSRRPGRSPSARRSRRSPAGDGSELTGTVTARYGLTVRHAAAERRRLHGQRHHADPDRHARARRSRSTSRCSWARRTSELPESDDRLRALPRPRRRDRVARPTCASTTGGGSTTCPTSTSRTRTSRRCPTTGRS